MNTQLKRQNASLTLYVIEREEEEREHKNTYIKTMCNITVSPKNVFTLSIIKAHKILPEFGPQYIISQNHLSKYASSIESPLQSLHDS